MYKKVRCTCKVVVLLIKPIVFFDVLPLLFTVCTAKLNNDIDV